MKTTNRVMNRVVLLLVGIVLLGAGVATIIAALQSAGASPAWLDGPVTAISEAWTTVGAWRVEVTGIGAVSVFMVAAAAAVIVLTMLLLMFVLSRRRGGSKNVLDVKSGDGRTTVDRNVADAVLTAPLNSRPDVIAARTSAYRLKTSHAIELAVTVRPGASLAAVTEAAETAIRDWDQLLGSRVPIMLHLSDRRWRDTFRARTRVS
ncbi:MULTISPECIES: hypothetical protein [unclassified Microbacterium]|uniref:hypothetical protein n=1 Tax=unclassified Microbacterium TaxID=2609290 RepID=UPI000EAA4498|nr:MULTISPECIES: hypothetical protein [unclassified Microbacterium]MBT2484974.1 hypothetical protein [Microbacterium sp. ISL-108]RKN67830.1 hypothetical protein D7252_09675 [Microbacterium sp. CGR2]